MKKKINILHVGLTGIPYVRSAPVNRCLTLYSILSENDYNVTAVNNRASDFSKILSEIKKEGKFLNINFKYTAPYPNKPNTFLKRRLNNLLGRICEFKLILKKSIKKEIHLMFFYPTGRFTELLYYSLFSKIFKYPIIVHYVEYRSAFKSRGSFFVRYNDRLFDKYLTFFSDGIIPISSFLVDKLKERSESIDYIKIPPLVDFSLFNSTTKISEKYFLYVGSVGYYDIIELLIKSFEQIKNKEFRLYMVLSGNLKKISNRIDSSIKKNSIRIFSNLDYEKLIELNINAKALLIPLRDNIQDKARFPQKISEYLASSNPIITTKFGEILFYFKDMQNALIAQENTTTAIKNKMDFVIQNPLEAKLIGQKGFATGMKFFNSESFKDPLNEFIIRVIKNSN